MSLRRLHRRLVIVLAVAGLIGFAAGAGFEPLSAILAGSILVAAFFWEPSERAATRLERLWIPLAAILILRTVLALFATGVDLVIPVVDLLLLLLCAETLRSPEKQNDVRLYALVFALFLASTAYRPGILFALSFLTLVILGSLALSIGLVLRKARRFGEDEPSVDRRFVRTSIALSGVTLMMSGAVFVTFPRINREWAGRSETLARSIAGFSDEVSLGQHGSSIYANPEIVLRVEFPNGRPENPSGLHWRGLSFDAFDGVRWSRTPEYRAANIPRQWYRDRWPDTVVAQRIHAAPLDVRVLFGLHPVVGIDVDSRIQPQPPDYRGDLFYWGQDEPVYTAYSMADTPPADELRAAERGFMPDRELYLQLSRLPDRVGELADSLTSGIESRYDQVIAVRDWLRSEFAYTRQLPATASQTSLDYFLFERRAGHCEYFSSAMVILLRSAGIHARNVNGFLGGRWNEFGEYLAVTQNEAHSWVEVWFPNFGWVPFDPTPSGDGGTADIDFGWFPGRFLFDGLQFRWNQWILDYSLTNQIDLFGTISEAFGGTGSDEPSGDGSGQRVWLLIAALALVAGGLWTVRGRGAPRRRESRAYLSLLAAARKSGIVGRESVTAGRLLRAIECERPAAAAPARAVVQQYRSARFGGVELDATAASELEQAARLARRRLAAPDSGSGADRMVD